jgi:competence protein ComK
MKRCDSYLINHCVLAIEPVFIGEFQSKITTTYGEEFSKLTPYQLLDKACMRYLSTMTGRKQAASKLLNFQNKTPILIEPYAIAAFPTMSSSRLECVWIFNHRFTVRELGKGRSEITFYAGTSIIVNVSKHTLLKQQLRLHTLIDMYRKITQENTYVKHK